MSAVTRRFRRAKVLVALTMGWYGLVVAGSVPSQAGNSYPSTSEVPPPADGPAKSLPGSTGIASEVRYHRSYDGVGPVMEPVAGARRAAPACWYEPRFSAAEFATYIDGHYVSDRSAWAAMAAKYGDDRFHEGQPGAWWELVVPDLGRADECAGLDDWAWVTQGAAPAGASATDPETLAGLAYAHTMLPVPPVALRPLPGNQLVNLGTEVALRARLERVTVTARLDDAALGIHVAATTVAEPYELRVDAGTRDADPATCTYALTGEGGTYRLDTRDAPCDVTYRRASPRGGYPLTASVVWHVHWTPSADPDGPAATGPALPDGASATPITVTVREAETLIR